MRAVRARVIRTVAVAGAVALSAQFAAAGAVADGSVTAGSGGSDDAATTRTHRVTLITGDVAELRVRADGSQTARLVPGSRHSDGAHAFHRGDDAYLVPSDAEPLLAADDVDIELFNVSDLVEHGYGDGASPSVPVILSYDDTSERRLRSFAAPRGAARSAVLPSIDAVAVQVGKDESRSFWTDVAHAASSTGARTTLAGSLDKIWLDAPVHGTLDQSAAQIGAPAAWERGLTGAGTTIAVLDSGIDATHPDFDGRILAASDFTGDGSTTDGAGHGTHVASIAAGSGAASEGRYRGIAPEADLLVGKVLGDDGTGTTSAAIAGMQWAAANGADVVNLSLGGPVTNGDDPMSQAVDTLTAQTDTLFVVAAGNYSPWAPGMEFVSAPASAASALAVGGLRTADGIWSGSRRGRMDGDAIKPEIVAPGFGITAAGASGAGLPPYVSNTGTSMAAPHVAGVAALLAQQHPDWDAARLRGALTSTAAPIADAYSTYEQGAGRVDADRATAQEVFADTGTLHLGYFSRPFDDDELRAERTITYRNDSDAPVTLDLTTTLRADGGSPADDALTVDPQTLTVPAGGSAETTVTLDATDVAAGTYSGHVTATSGKLRVGTAIGFYKQDDTVDVTVRALDRNGEPGYATVRITPYQEHDGRYYPEYIYLTPAQREHTVRLPAGRYNVWSLITTHDESGRYAEQESIVGDPRLDVEAPNFDLTLDAREAVPISVRTPRPSEPRSIATSWWRGEPGSTLFNEDTWYVSSYDGEPEILSVTPTEQVDDAPFGFTTTFDSGVAPLEAAAPGVRLEPVQVTGRPINGRHRLPVVDAGTASPADLDGLDLTGALALVQESPQLGHSEQVAAATAAGARMVALYSAQPGVFWPRNVNGGVPVLALPRDQGKRLAARAADHPVRVQLDGTPRTPYAYDLTFTEEGEVPSRLAYRVLPRDLATIETRIHTTGTSEHGWRMRQVLDTDCGCGPGAVDDYVPSTGYTRTEYVTARPDLDTISAWRFLFNLPGDVLYSRDSTTYEPGETVEREWLKAPLSPGVPQSDIRAGGRSPVSKRIGDHLYYGLATVTDSAGHWTPNFTGTTVASRLYRDGEKIYDSAWALTGSANVPADVATYRIEADVDHDGSLLGLSTQTRSAWTFESAGNGDTQVLPLIDVDYTDVVDARTGRSALDLANTALADRRVRLELAASHQVGSRAPDVDEMSVQVSFDGGATWTEADVDRDGAAFSATYRHPRADDTDGYAALRVRASDPAGGVLEQTLIRAYRIEAP